MNTNNLRRDGKGLLLTNGVMKMNSQRLNFHFLGVATATIIEVVREMEEALNDLNSFLLELETKAKNYEKVEA